MLCLSGVGSDGKGRDVDGREDAENLEGENIHVFREFPENLRKPRETCGSPFGNILPGKSIFGNFR